MLADLAVIMCVAALTTLMRRVQGEYAWLPFNQ